MLNSREPPPFAGCSKDRQGEIPYTSRRMQLITATMNLDFLLYHVASQMILNGKNPWSFEEYNEALLSSSVFFGSHIPAFPALPWGTWAWVPLGFLPFEIAFMVTQIITVIVTTLVCLFYGKIETNSRSNTEPTNLLIISMLLFCYYPFFKCVATAQLSVLPLLCVFLFFLLRKKSLFLSGLTLSLTFIRPQNFLPLYFWVTIGQVRQRNIPFLLGVAVGTMLQTALTFYILPAREFNLVNIVQNLPLSEHMRILTPTFTSLFATALSFSYQQGLFSIICSLLVAIAVSFTAYGEPLKLFILLAAGLLLSPYSWTHDYLLLAPFVTSFYLSQRSNWVRLLYVVFLTLGFIYCFNTMSREYNGVYFFIVLISYMLFNYIRIHRTSTAYQLPT